VNHRSEDASLEGSTKAVSDRFISAATSCIHADFTGRSSTQTAAGLPRKRSPVNASTW
jgi:hypothetical protein